MLFLTIVRNLMIKCNNAKKVTFLLTQIRTLSHHHLPLSHSFIPYDILLTIYSYSINDGPPSVKILFASLKHSESGIRYHFERLKSMGWIELLPSERDNRVKHCSISNKYAARISEYFAAVEQLTFEVSNDKPSSQPVSSHSSRQL